MSKLLKAIREAVPSAPLLIGEVVAAQGDELRIQTPDAGLYSARGSAALGDLVFFRPAGAVEGAAPAGTYVDIEV